MPNLPNLAHGQIVNVPLREGSGGAAMRAAYEARVFPALDAFRPELLLVSAGVDAHADDPLAGLEWQAEDYLWLTGRLRAAGAIAQGVEVDHGRAAFRKAKGYGVLRANFLEVMPSADLEFDAVVMNPPFYGRHYAKHVRHALKFLKANGILVSILPSTARYDHDELSGEWRDLPVASFAEAGTNVPTSMLRIVNRQAA